jgi:hypothetical protein
MSKKNYQAPKLSVYGAVENLTQQGGGGFTDVPYGTPVGPDATIGDVTGDPKTVGSP